MFANPYAADLGGRNPLKALAETPATDSSGGGVRGDRRHVERTYAPGKWSFRQVLVHLAQAELALPRGRGLPW